MLARDMSEWAWQGERGMLRSFEGTLAEANAAARALSDVVASEPFPEIADVVPGARSVLVELLPGVEPSERLQEVVGSAPAVGAARLGSQQSVAVAYDGPDVEDVARLAGLSVGE